MKGIRVVAIMCSLAWLTGCHDDSCSETASAAPTALADHGDDFATADDAAPVWIAQTPSADEEAISIIAKELKAANISMTFTSGLGLVFIIVPKKDALKGIEVLRQSSALKGHHTKIYSKPVVKKE